ncbi:MAG TPA: DUF6519 domain-containing protein [Jiangellaceae bacterium]
MKGDFTRDSFDHTRHYTRVAMQRGRVQLDADWNEQASITQHYLRTLALDLIGPYGGPVGTCGFAVITDPGQVDGLTDAYGTPLDGSRRQHIRERLRSGDFLIGAGRYYVDGLLCENEAPLTYTQQPGYPFTDRTALENLGSAEQVLIYLDVWERHVSAAEDPGIVEVALGGPDTSTRVQLVWQVKVFTGDGRVDCGDLDALRRTHLPTLRAAAQSGSHARYSGLDNRLYRVEIHRGGTARAAGAETGGATFKWSRENGSVVFPVRSVSPDSETGRTTVELAAPGHGQGTALAVGDLVELVDDAHTLREAAEPLFVVASTDHDSRTFVLTGLPVGTTGQGPRLHPLLRRWDHGGGGANADTDAGGAVLVTEATGADDGWIHLKDGVVVQFPSSGESRPQEYRTGDYWLIPARTATTDVVWPRHEVAGRPVPAARPPRGVQHHYAPLALATRSGSGGLLTVTTDCRSAFEPLPRTGGITAGRPGRTRRPGRARPPRPGR